MTATCPLCGGSGELLFSKVDCGTRGCRNYLSRLDTTPEVGCRVGFTTTHDQADWTDEEFFLLSTELEIDGRLAFGPGYEEAINNTVLHIEDGFVILEGFPRLYCPLSAVRKIIY
jgi:hypothetical protein